MTGVSPSRRMSCARSAAPPTATYSRRLDAHGGTGGHPIRHTSLAHRRNESNGSLKKGGTPDKPVGMVCLAWARRDAPVDSMTRYFDGDRQQIRQKTVEAALDRLLDYARSGTDGRS